VVNRSPAGSHEPLAQCADVVDRDWLLTNVMLYWPTNTARSSANWAEYESGGHFAALETPDLLIADVREFFRGI
jgi:hypothetical protein